MKKLQSFTRNLFTQWVIFQLFSDLLHLIKSTGSEALKAFIQPLLSVFENAFNKYDVTLLAAKNAEAPTVFDEKRDWGIKELYAIAAVYADHFLKPAKQQAALFLLAIFKRYGTGADISKLPQDDESGVLTNILQELTADAANPHTTALDVVELVEYIAENNTGFIAGRRLVTEENMQLAGQVKTARSAAENAWSSLRDAINGYAVVNVADADCAALINSLNATIDRYKSNARRARGGKPREDASPETPGETATDTPAQD